MDNLRLSQLCFCIRSISIGDDYNVSVKARKTPNMEISASVVVVKLGYVVVWGNVASGEAKA